MLQVKILTRSRLHPGLLCVSKAEELEKSEFRCCFSEGKLEKVIEERKGHERKGHKRNLITYLTMYFFKDQR